MMNTEQLIATNTKIIKQRDAYQKCVNRIDDLLEYRYRNLTNQEIRDMIIEHIDNLTVELVRINST